MQSARLLYDVSEKARRIVESYFQLNSTLYFSYTHMVCRTALPGTGVTRSGEKGRVQANVLGAKAARLHPGGPWSIFSPLSSFVVPHH